MKFTLEIVDAICKIKEKYNSTDFIVGYHLSPEEPYEKCITMNETLKLVKALLNKPIQFIHISKKDYHIY